MPSLLNNPFGHISFDEFQQDKVAFADKTGFIEGLDTKSMSRFPLLLRPRCFGKSAFILMLKCFYDISYKDRYEELFSKTAIYEKDLSSKNTYHVIDFDFSGILGRDVNTLVNGFIIAIKSGIADFKKRYPDFVFNPAKNETKTPSGLLKTFLSAYKTFSSKKLLYVMIDEYDNFARNLLFRDEEQSKTITEAYGFIAAFYETIKSGANDCISKTFITGVLPVSLNSLVSGFDISLNVTSEPKFSTYAGFTEEELGVLIPKLVDTDKFGVSVSNLITLMKPVYGGYCFSAASPKTVFNSSLCLFYLHEIAEQEQLAPPELCLAPSCDHYGKKLEHLLNTAGAGLADDILDTYLSGKCFFVSQLYQNFDLIGNTDRDREKLLSILYHLGYLTTAPKFKGGRLTLRIPNLLMARSFDECAVNLRLTPDTAFTSYALDISTLENTEDDLSSFAVSCTEFLSSIVANPILTHRNEKALNLTLYAKLSQTRGIQAKMQKPLRIPAINSTGEDEPMADLVVTVNRGKSNECVYLFKLRHLPEISDTDKREGNENNYESELRRLKRESENKALMYCSALDFSGKQIKSYVMIFQGPKCILCEKQNNKALQHTAELPFADIPNMKEHPCIQSFER